MTGTAGIEGLVRSTVIDSETHEVGPVTAVFVDEESSRPEWAAVAVGGLMGRHQRLVPLAAAQLSAGALHVHYTRDQIRESPEVDVDRNELEPATHELLAEYWEREPQSGSNVEGTVGMMGEVPAGLGSASPAERALPDRRPVAGVSGRSRLRRWAGAESSGDSGGVG